jgi:acyl-CoA synthetase (AMP-forming)/AMP-acid ligase II
MEAALNIGMLLDMASSEFGDRVALGSASSGTTYSQLSASVIGGASLLRDAGAGSLAFVGLNSPALPTLLFTAAAAGIPFAPLNYRLESAALRRLLDRLEHPVVVADPAFADVVRGDGRQVVTTQDWIARAEAAPPAPLQNISEADESEAAVLLFTSGTTAAPKCVVLHHAHLLSYVLTTVEFGSADAADSSLVSVPPYHVAAIGSALSNIYAGRRIAYLPDFSAAAWLDIARKEAVTSAMVVPTMLARIVEHLDGAPADCPRLATLAYGGARMPAPVLAQALRAFPTTGFVNAYGLTETSSTISVLDPEDHRQAVTSADPRVRARLASVGRLIPGVEAQIREEDGTVRSPGATGELWVRGEQVSGEYADEGSILDSAGWFPTHDRARIDEDGYLFLDGRSDDTIIRAGENISPAEVEDALLEHAGVGEAVVVGVPDDEWGERLVAVVVPSGRAVLPAPATLREFVRERVRGSRTPDQIVVRAELPYTPTGKVIRRQLVQELSTTTGPAPELQARS